MSAPFMQLYVADYLGDTRHLTTEQHGAYILLLMTMWRSEGRLPNDAKKLARITGCSASRWARISVEVLEFFKVDGDSLTNKRLMLELEKASEKSIQRAVSGSLGGKARALKTIETNVAKATDLLCHSSEPEPEPEEDKTAHAVLCADGFFEEALDVYPQSGLSRTNVPEARDLWLGAAIKAGGGAELVARIKSFAASPLLAKRDHGAPGLQRWLIEERWRAEAGGEALSRAKPKWTGPIDLRNAVVSERGDAFATSYLDPAGWTDAGEVVAATGFAAEKLRPLDALRGRRITVRNTQPQEAA